MRQRTVRGKHLRYVGNHSSRRVERYSVEDRGYETPCWIWQRFTAPTGHAMLKVGDDERGAHVVYYERRYGPVPRGYHVHHKCEHGACVNPDHLEALTPAEHKQAHSKLSAADVDDIRRRVRQGELQKALAREYGVSRQTVCDMVHRRTWRDVA